MPNSKSNNRAHCKTIFKQTFRFAKDVPEQKISPEGFLIRDCGCVMRFLPTLDSKTKSPLATVNKNQNPRQSSPLRQLKHLQQTTTISTEMNNRIKIEKKSSTEKVKNKTPQNIQQTALYQSTFWMEPRVVPVKYTTEVNFNLESPTKRFTETIDLEMKLVPCPYIHKIGTTTHFKTSIETRIQSEYTLPIDTTI